MEEYDILKLRYLLRIKWLIPGDLQKCLFNSGNQLHIILCNVPSIRRHIYTATKVRNLRTLFP